VDDYGVEPSRVEVLGNVIDVDAFSLSEETFSTRATIVVLGRVVVRKGVEDIVSLSHRLNDLSDAVEIVVVGEGSLWSDYTALLKDLNPAIARSVGRMSRDDVIELLARSRLLIQASHYEPFGLTVGEALACGVPVVATDQVGAAEHLDPLVCTVVPDGDLDALEAAVRAELSRGPLDTARRVRCREEVVRRYSAPVIGRRALELLTQLAQD
jgi:glycosyltransferase involved in cell wall biosynthesis